MLQHPVDIGLTLSVSLPHAFELEDAVKRIDNDQFQFDYAVKATERHVLVTYKYQTKQDEVSVADLPRYLRDLSEARKLLHYGLWTPKVLATAEVEAESSPLNWPVLGFTLLAAILMWLLAQRLLRRPHTPSPAARRAAAAVDWGLALVSCAGFDGHALPLDIDRE